MVVVHQDERDAFAAPRSLAVGFSNAGERIWEKWLPGKVTGVISSAQPPVLGIWQRSRDGAVLGMNPIDPRTGELGGAISQIGLSGPWALWAGDENTVAVVEGPGGKAKGGGPGPILSVRTLDGRPLWRSTIRGDISQVDVVAPAWDRAFLVAGSKPGASGDSVAMALATPDGIARRDRLPGGELGEGATSEVFDAARLPDGSLLVAGTTSLASKQGWRRSVWLRRLHP